MGAEPCSPHSLIYREVAVCLLTCFVLLAVITGLYISIHSKRSLFSKSHFAMIFGISVSDIYGCARLAYGLYEELKQAPGDCQAFAQELLLFHQMLIKISTINSENGHLDHSDQAALSACLDSCKELLCKQIVGIQEMPADLDKVGVDLVTPLPIRSEYKDYGLPFHRNVGLFRTWRQRFEKRKLALQIPKLQRAISAHIEKLNIFLELYVFTIHEARFAADLPVFQTLSA